MYNKHEPKWKINQSPKLKSTNPTAPVKRNDVEIDITCEITVSKHMMRSYMEFMRDFYYRTLDETEEERIAREAKERSEARNKAIDEIIKDLDDE